MKNENLVPVIVHDLIRRFDPNNRITNETEKLAAEATLRAIIAACEAGLKVKKDYLKIK